MLKSISVPGLLLMCISGATAADDVQPQINAAMPSAQAMTGISEPGQLQDVSRTIEVYMSDAMRFTPAEIEVDAGETVHFLVRNNGVLAHEMAIGSEPWLLAHLDQIRDSAAATEARERQPNWIALAPGSEGHMVMRFVEPGTVHFACMIPDHFDAGMRGVIQVEAKEE